MVYLYNCPNYNINRFDLKNGLNYINNKTNFLQTYINFYLKMSSIQQDEQSIQLTIQPARNQTKQNNKSAHKSQVKHKQKIIHSQLKYNVSKSRLDLYLTINKTYFQNLIKRRQKPAFSDNHAIRTQVGNNCIIFKQFQLREHQVKQLMDQETKIQGKFYINYNQNTFTQFKVYFNNKNVKRQYDYIWALFYYQSSYNWKTKNITMNQQTTVPNTFSCKISNDQINDYLNPCLLINVTLKRKETSNSNYLGIVNLGNTCFMNTSLQLLFYIRPLRKIILESKSTNQIIVQLKNVFLKLLDTEQKDPVDLQNFIRSYDRFNIEPRQQQDVQQFLFSFIEEIQRQCPQTKALWQGKCIETTYSKQSQKPYHSQQKQNFCQLDVHMIDHNGNYYKNIQESLKYLTSEEEVDDLIENDQFGKIFVGKKKKFQELPDIIFINLKRYEWNKQKCRLSKILGHVQYKEKINLGFLIDTPGGEDYQNPETQYVLYSVIVHKGTSPQSGHYFVFINTSSDPQSPQWLQFNDSLVRNSDVQEILSFTGKKKRQILLNKEVGNFMQSYIQSDDSSYLLVYIRKASFSQYQSLRTNLPRQYLIEKRKRKAQKQNENIQQINVYFISQEQRLKQQKLDLFGDSLQFTQVPLNKNNFVYQQIQKIEKQYFGIKNQIMFRVTSDDKKISLIQKNDTLQDVISCHMRSVKNFNYILLIPQDIQKYDMSTMKKFGLIVINKNQLKNIINYPKVALITPEELLRIQNKVKIKGGFINYLNSKQDFESGWNKYIQIEIYKKQISQEIDQKTINLDD